jgi:hypothetical protein
VLGSTASLVLWKEKQPAVVSRVKANKRMIAFRSDFIAHYSLYLVELRIFPSDIAKCAIGVWMTIQGNVLFLEAQIPEPVRIRRINDARLAKNDFPSIY